MSQLTQGRSKIKRVLLKHFGAFSASLLPALEKEFALITEDLGFVAASRNPMDRRLPMAALFLALVKILHQHGQSYEQIRNLCLEVATELARPRSGLHLVFKRLLTGLFTSRVVQYWLARKMAATQHKTEPMGFSLAYVSSAGQDLVFGFDVLECGICKLFKKHQYEQYTKILCEIDYLTAQVAGLTLQRTNTLANHGPKCDFRFARKSNL